MTRRDFVVELVQAPAHVAVVVRGELDLHSEAAAHAALSAAAERGVRVVLDLRALDFVDSAGLKLAIVWNRGLLERGIPLTIVRGPQHVQRSFTSAGLDDLLPFADEPPA